MSNKDVRFKQQDSDTIENALKMLSPRWTTAILIQLASGKKRFAELHTALAPLSAKTLTERLKLLRYRGLLTRKSFKQVPPRVEYELTESGKELMAILQTIKAVSTKMPKDELHDWGNPSQR